MPKKAILIIPMSSVVSAVWILAVIALVWLVVAAAKDIGRQLAKRSRPTPRPRQTFGPTPVRQPPDPEVPRYEPTRPVTAEPEPVQSVVTEPASSQNAVSRLAILALQEHLLSILNQDQASAKQILKQVQREYPLESMEWYYRRAISLASFHCAPATCSPSAGQSESYPSESLVNELYTRLITMLNGDRPAVDRLVTHVQRSSPGMPMAWYFEKVIHDLERDRF